MKAFLAACLAAIVLAAISWIILNSLRGRWTGHLPRPPTRGSAIRPGAVTHGTCAQYGSPPASYLCLRFFDASLRRRQYFFIALLIARFCDGVISTSWSYLKGTTR